MFLLLTHNQISQGCLYNKFSELVSLLVGYQPTGAVEYISYNMGTFDLPEIYTLALGPSCSCVYFRQITRAHVITITCYLHAMLTC